MPGRTQGESLWNPTTKGGRGTGGWGQGNRQSAGDGQGRWRRQTTKNAGGWSSRGKQAEQPTQSNEMDSAWIAAGSGDGDGTGNGSGNAWDTNYNNTASAWAEAPIYTVEDGWDVAEPKVETMEDILRRLAVHSDDFKKDLIPFFLKSVAAAEKEEPEVKLESFLEDKVQARKASGWYWTGSDIGKKDGDGWSNHKASDNGWGDNGNRGWGVQSGWVPTDDTPKDNGWGSNPVQRSPPNPAPNPQNQWRSRRPHNKRRGHG